MNAFYALFLVFALIVIAIFGAGAAGLTGLFGIWIPYAAVCIFILGFSYRIYKWAKSPVPFKIPTTAGQQKTLEWIPQARVENPVTRRQVVIRMIFEVLLFRSLFRSTKVELHAGDPEEPVVAYRWTPLLWFFGITLHYSFLVILIRHLRFFLEPVPEVLVFLDSLDGLFQIGVPVLYLTNIGILLGAGYLLLRRLILPQMRYISLPADYFPLFLILAIALSGIYMRYLARVDVLHIKEMTMSLVLFNPHIPEAGLDLAFYVHLFLVSVLWAYFPFSKLMHLGGVFLSPSRNVPNNTRIKHHENPWNPHVPPHSYEAYEDDFREAMVEVGLPVEKQPEPKSESEGSEEG
jgi:nitrate reductase gamma subunit